MTVARQVGVPAQRHEQLRHRLDLTNAFNSVDRTRLLSVVYATPQLAPLWCIITLAYARESHLLLNRGQLSSMLSTNGMRQGDGLSSLLFCVYIKDVLADVAGSQAVRPYACMDDIHLVAEPQQLKNALHHLQQSLPPLGLHLNTSKSHLAYFHQAANPLSPDVLEWCVDNGIRVEHEQPRVLGAIVARDDDALTSALRNATQTDYATTPFFRRLLSAQIAPQAAMLLLRQCGLPRMRSPPRW